MASITRIGRGSRPHKTPVAQSELMTGHSEIVGGLAIEINNALYRYRIQFTEAETDALKGMLGDGK